MFLVSFGAACVGLGFWLARSFPVDSEGSPRVGPGPGRDQAFRADADPAEDVRSLSAEAPSTGDGRSALPASNSEVGDPNPRTTPLESDRYALPTDEELMERYGSMGKFELLGAAEGLGWAFSSDVSVLLEEQFDRGLYRVYANAAGVPIETSAAAERGGLQASMQRMIPRDDGSLEVQVATVAYEDYPALRAKAHELRWVWRRLRDEFGVDPLNPYGRREPEENEGGEGASDH